MAIVGQLNLPLASPSVQQRSREEWNATRSLEDADFYTFGYMRRDINDLLLTLSRAGVETVIDVRHYAVSMYRPDFSKRNLQRHLYSYDLKYVHLPELGVPREIRELAYGPGERSSIWMWYDQQVVPGFAQGNLTRFFNIADHPVAFMCVEMDPQLCHRHRLALALERNGLKGFDI